MSLDKFLSKKDKTSKKPTLEEDSPAESITKDVSTSNLSSDYLWALLVETVKTDVVLFPTLKGYVQNKILPNESNITPEELALRLSISVGTALVILSELKSNSNSPPKHSEG